MAFQTPQLMPRNQMLSDIASKKYKGCLDYRKDNIGKKFRKVTLLTSNMNAIYMLLKAKKKII